MSEYHSLVAGYGNDVYLNGSNPVLILLATEPINYLAVNLQQFVRVA